MRTLSSIICSKRIVTFPVCCPMTLDWYNPATSWSPGSLSGLFQRFLDATPTYYASTLASLPIITPEETGTLAVPRPGTCASFDLVDDYVQTDVPAQTGVMTFCAWIKPTSAALSGSATQFGACVFSNCQSNGNDFSFGCNVGRTYGGADGTKLNFGHTGAGLFSAGSISSSAWWHIAIARSGSTGNWTYRVYINGALDSTQTTTSNPTTTSADKFTIGRLGAFAGLYYGGLLSDLRVYSVAKTGAEIASIYAQADHPDTIDTAGLVAHYWFNEGAGNNVFDCGPNRYVGTCRSITTSTFWTSDGGVTYNPANELGGRVGTNLISNSNGAGIAGNGTVTANNATSPTGATDASRFVPTGSNTSHYVSLQGSNPAAGPHAFSTHLKAGAITTVRLYLYDPAGTGDSRGAIFNLSNGTVGTIESGVTAAIESKGGGWYRCSISKTMGAHSGNGGGIQAVVGGQLSYSANGTDEFYFCGSQIEYDTSAHGYIRTGSTGSSPSIWINRDEADPTKDITGETLQIVGPLKLPATTEVPCVTGDGSAVYVDLGSALIPASADFSISLRYYNASTSIASILGQFTAATAGRFGLVANSSNTSGTTTSGSLEFWCVSASANITLSGALTTSAWHDIQLSRSGNVFTLTCTPVGGSTVTGTVTAAATVLQVNTKLLALASGTIISGGRVSALSITTGGVTKTFPLQEGPGTGNTNRTVYWVASDGTSGTVTNAITSGTVATIWGNRCPYAQDHGLNYGLRVASGVAIPGRIGAGLGTAADGNANTSPVGKRRNPYTAILPNYWGAPSLNNIGYTSSTRLYYGDAVQSISPADTKFRRTASSGDDRYFAVRAALTGSYKTNAQTYVT